MTRDWESQRCLGAPVASSVPSHGSGDATASTRGHCHEEPVSHMSPGLRTSSWESCLPFAAACVCFHTPDVGFLAHTVKRRCWDENAIVSGEAWRTRVGAHSESPAIDIDPAARHHPGHSNCHLSIGILCNKAKETESGLIFNIGTNLFCAELVFEVGFAGKRKQGLRVRVSWRSVPCPAQGLCLFSWINDFLWHCRFGNAMLWGN